MLTKDLAETIVRETMQRLNRNINIFDADGIVLASGDAGRVGQRHEAALKAIRRNTTYLVAEGDETRWKGAAAGINLPVVYGGVVVGAIGITGRADEVQPFGELVKMTAELMMAQRQAELLHNWKQLVADRITDELLEGEVPALDELNGRLRPLGLTLQPPYVVATVGVSPAADEADDTRLFHTLADRLAGQALIGRRRDSEWVILFAKRQRDRIHSLLEDVLRIGGGERRTLAIGVGTAAPDLRQIADSYRESKAVLKLAPERESGIFYYEERPWEAALADIPALLRRRLSEWYKPLLPPKVRETLACLFRHDLNMAAAAAALGIHRNTMIYRLERIRADTGRDPQRFQDALALQLALWLLEQEERERGLR